MLKNLQIFLFCNSRVYLVHVSFSTYPDLNLVLICNFALLKSILDDFNGCDLFYLGSCRCKEKN